MERGGERIALRAGRLEGWESRLAAVIEGARAQPYVLGEHDCFRVACQAVAALTGVDHWPAWAGRYRTEHEALALIVRYATAGGWRPGDELEAFDAAFSRLFGVGPVSAALAARGDIVKYVDARPHLGVCVGREVAVLGPERLAFAPRSRCNVCWRIG